MLWGMHYEPPRQEKRKDPSGCLETITISRMIVSILLVPLTLIIGGIFAELIALFLLTIHPLFALLFVLGAVLLLMIAARWEARRVGRERPPNEL